MAQQNAAPHLLRPQNHSSGVATANELVQPQAPQARGKDASHTIPTAQITLRQGFQRAANKEAACRIKWII
ncbi:hypothetical protein C3432_16885 [Citrobacter amalonaticus]|uniref:Uncharacterized protein n=1 Tax=Citrobacter amalonaticus TaxID=35703 RepID=A0A2S4RU50_CITAM|nr:hypothetical protein C3432_16885 [Citrobacter amalonaticus]POT72668.1 hypothetical protein C3436_21000 [Citrobacter amalonaticus]POU63523.1 hypothetical protein C3430_19255 [Citrobacter amalonaticus]POV03287.1 hypothetical protein C3424_22170 [Citrobacter amalonaticus]